MIMYDFQNSIGFIINRMGKSLVYVIDQELRKKFGITFGQWKVLIILANNAAGLTQREIADKLALEGPTLIPIIDKLEKDVFVIRKIDPRDRRINRILLTEKAHGFLDDTIECVSQIKKICLDQISEEDISTTKKTLEQMWLNLQDKFNLNCSEEIKQKRELINQPTSNIIIEKRHTSTKTNL
jgi:MarR family transcriptional regulator, transcriptional regulator for hemolysin